MLPLRRPVRRIGGCFVGRSQLFRCRLSIRKKHRRHTLRVHTSERRLDEAAGGKWEADDTQTRESGVAEQRRSPRILRRLVVRIDYGDSFCTAHTAVINRHGAMVLSRVPLEKETGVHVTNLQTGRTAAFRVVWCGEPTQGHHKLGIELLEELDFWGPAYDPGPED